jgi:hypothetical protein
MKFLLKLNTNQVGYPDEDGANQLIMTPFSKKELALLV